MHQIVYAKWLGWSVNSFRQGIVNVDCIVYMKQTKISKAILIDYFLFEVEVIKFTRKIV